AEIRQAANVPIVVAVYLIDISIIFIGIGRSRRGTCVAKRMRVETSLHQSFGSTSEPDWQCRFDSCCTSLRFPFDRVRAAALYGCVWCGQLRQFCSWAHVRSARISRRLMDLLPRDTIPDSVWSER